MVHTQRKIDLPTWDPERPFPSIGAPPIEVAGRTDTGLVRDGNEDQYLVTELRRHGILHATSLEDDSLFGEGDALQGLLMIVADGMGGHGNGETASKVAVRTVARRFLERLPWSHELENDSVPASLGAAIEDAVKSAHEALTRLGDEGKVDPHLGTTLTLAYVVWPHVIVGHVGDSRCYLWHRGDFGQLTKDHTMAEEIRSQFGGDPPERYEHILSNAIGGNEKQPVVELCVANLAHGDRLLVCTDGLTGHVSNEALAEIIGGRGSSAEACEACIDAANKDGGRDNITAIVARIG